MNQTKQITIAWLFFTIVWLTAPSALGQQAEAFDGKPTFTEGLDLGYYIWRDGDTWHVRWTTKGTKRHFAGLVLAEGGDLKSLKRIDLESRTLVVRRGRQPQTTIDRRGRIRRSNGGGPVVTSRKQDTVEKDGGQRIRFSSQNDGDIDGFDFKVDQKVTALRFTLEINGKAAHKYVEAGKNNQKMVETPFTVKLR